MFLVSILRSYGARKTLNDRCYKHLVPTGRKRFVPMRSVPTRRRLASTIRQLVFTRRWLNAFVAIAIALSFIATLIPVASASLSKATTMACCVGKTAGHCDSGIAAKKVPLPKSEPMCGLHGAELEEDGITIVAKADPEPANVESQHSHSQTAETNSSQPVAESASLSQPCHMDCASCAAGATRQQKRERNTVQPTISENAPSTTLSFDEDQPLLFSSSRNWEHVIPRGPPAKLR